MGGGDGVDHRIAVRLAEVAAEVNRTRARGVCEVFRRDGPHRRHRLVRIPFLHRDSKLMAHAQAAVAGGYGDGGSPHPLRGHGNV